MGEVSFGRIVSGSIFRGGKMLEIKFRSLFTLLVPLLQSRSAPPSERALTSQHFPAMLAGRRVMLSHFTKFPALIVDLRSSGSRIAIRKIRLAMAHGAIAGRRHGAVQESVQGRLDVLE